MPIPLPPFRMISIQMFDETTVRCVADVTFTTRMWPCTCMRSHMLGKTVMQPKSSITHGACVGHNSRMDGTMSGQCVGCRKGHGTHFTDMRPIVGMHSHVNFQIIFPSEATIADVTAEILSSRMDDCMFLQCSVWGECDATLVADHRDFFRWWFAVLPSSRFSGHFRYGSIFFGRLCNVWIWICIRASNL